MAVAWLINRGDPNDLPAGMIQVCVGDTPSCKTFADQIWSMLVSELRLVFS